MSEIELYYYWKLTSANQSLMFYKLITELKSKERLDAVISYIWLVCDPYWQNMKHIYFIHIYVGIFLLPHSMLIRWLLLI